MANPTASRGYRNRNPGNIDYNPANKWQGQVGKESGPNGRFTVFETHEYGIRALAMLLTTYFDRYGLDTVRGIINRWAPSHENNTAAYIAAAARAVGVAPDDRVDLHTYAHMRPLVVAIITHELGGQPYAASVIDEGLRLAGLKPKAPSLAAAAATPEGKNALGWAGMAAAASTAAPAIQAMSGLPQWVGVALVVAVAAVAVALILTRRRDAPA